MKRERHRIGGCRMICFRWSPIALPQPEGPTTAANSPVSSENDISDRAFVSPSGV